LSTSPDLPGEDARGVAQCQNHSRGRYMIRGIAAEERFVDEIMRYVGNYVD
jgi:hypothetical protein